MKSEGGNMAENKQSEIFNIALKMRDFEITQLSQRNNFFMIFQGVLFSGFVQSTHKLEFVSLMVCFAGFFASIFQIGMASGAKFWQEYWEQKVSDFESLQQVDNKNEKLLFHDKKKIYKDTVRDRLKQQENSEIVNDLVFKKYSVSRIPVYIGLIFSVIWASLAIFFLTNFIKL